MAFAPLSQTIFLTEDGSVPTNQSAVTIPPLLSLTPTPTTPTIDLAAYQIVISRDGARRAAPFSALVA